MTAPNSESCLLTGLCLCLAAQNVVAAVSSAATGSRRPAGEHQFRLWRGPDGLWTGEIELEGKKWDVALADSVVTPSQSEEAEAGFYLRMHGSGDSAAFTPFEKLHVPDRLCLAGRAYEVTTRPPPGKDRIFTVLTLKEQCQGVRPVEVVGKRIRRLLLHPPTYTVIDSPGSQVMLPVGAHQVSWVLLEGGALCHIPRWIFREVRVRRFGPSRLVLGAPLDNTVSIRRHGDGLRLSYRLLGVGGEHHDLVDMARLHSELAGSSAIPEYELRTWWGTGPLITPGHAPPMFVVHRSGEVIHSGSFRESDDPPGHFSAVYRPPPYAFAKLEIVVSRGVGELGPRQGEPVVIYWTRFHRQLHFLLPLMVMPLLLLRSNRDCRAWLALVPLAVICVPLGAIAVTSPQLWNPLSQMWRGEAIALTGLWLLTGSIAKRHWLFGVLLTGCLMMVVGLAESLLAAIDAVGGICPKMLFEQQIPGAYTFAIGSLFGLLCALTAARLCCRGSLTPKAFVVRLLLWLMPATAVCLTVADIIWISLTVPWDDLCDGVAFMPFFGPLFGIGLYIFVLPFVALAHFSRFWRERLAACLGARDGGDCDRTVQ